MTPRTKLQLHTVEEVAETFRKSVRWVREFAGKHGIGAKAGRDWLFSDDDVSAMWEAMQCRLRSSQAVTDRPTSTCAEPSADSALTKALALATHKPQKKSGSSEKASYSNVRSMDEARQKRSRKRP